MLAQQMNINISAKRIAKLLAFLSLGLMLAGLGGIIAQQFFGDFLLKPTLIRLTDLKEEVSIGTWYSSSILLLSSLLLLVISLVEQQAQQPNIRHWRFLSFLFLFLSLDEAASIHEVGDGLHDILGVNSATTFLWTVPYTIALVLLIFFYAKFLVVLPQKTRSLFIASGAIFIAGALGLELFAAALTQAGFAHIVPISILVEEFCEMLGVTIFIYALVDYIRSRVKDIHLQFKRN